MKRLTINKQILKDELIVEFIGSIDEDSDFRELIGLDQKSITFDLKRVNMINSCGIREWIRFLDKIPGEIHISYRSCPQIIIEQMNMVHGFIRKGATISSFFAPYFCEKCNKETKVEMATDKVVDRKAPEMQCPHCSNKLEFDAVETQYMSFLGKK